MGYVRMPWMSGYFRYVSMDMQGRVGVNAPLDVKLSSHVLAIGPDRVSTWVGV